jgi:hypothetical protein
VAYWRLPANLELESRADRGARRQRQCGRSLVAGTPLRGCVSGHKIHQTCLKYAMNREVCPICGIYVSASEADVYTRISFLLHCSNHVREKPQGHVTL